MRHDDPAAEAAQDSGKVAAGRHDEELLRRFVDDAPVAIAMLDGELCYLAASRRWIADFGLDAATYLGRRHYDLFSEMPDHWKAVHRRCLTGAVEECDGEPFDRGDGRRRWVRWAIHPWSTASGAVGGLLMFSEDITARMEAETALRESRDHERETAEAMRLLLQTASEGIVHVDAHGVIRAANAATESLFGWRADELVGRSIEDLMPASLRQAHARYRASYFSAPRPRPMGRDLNLIGQRKDGSTFPVEISLNHVMTPTGARAVAFVTDISARKAAEDALRESHVALEAYSRELERRADRLRELASELTVAEQHAREQISKTLHDGLQQLLFSSRLKIDRLGRRLADGADSSDLVASLRQELDDAIAQARSLSVELFPAILHTEGLPAGLTWLAEWVRGKYGLTVELAIDPTADVTRRDVRTLVFESVRELLFNVVKHAKIDRAALDLVRTPGGAVRIVAEDRGVGFDPAIVHDPAHAHRPGLGLLSIRERLAWFGGLLDIQSAPGKGTRFTLIVPDEPRRAARSTRRPLTVLIADDHALARDELRQLLAERSELRIVGEALDGLQAVALAHSLRPDVIIMDVSMPHLDGVEATRRIRAELPSVQIFGLSTEERSDRLHAMEVAGASGYFTKGQDAQHLLARLLAVRTADGPTPPPAPPASDAPASG